jgi:hypothetical protein
MAQDEAGHLALKRALTRGIPFGPAQGDVVGGVYDPDGVVNVVEIGQTVVEGTVRVFDLARNLGSLVQKTKRTWDLLASMPTRC